MMGRLATVVGLGLLTVMAALGLLTGCESAAQSSSNSSSSNTQTTTATAAVPEAIPVEVIAVDRQSIASHLQGTATLESEEEIQVLAEAAGRTTQVRMCG